MWWFYIFYEPIGNIYDELLFGYFTELHKEVQSFTESPELELDEIIHSLYF
jgi:hypothetical protein